MYVYTGEGGGEVPEDVVRVRVDPSVTSIPASAFFSRQKLEAWIGGEFEVLIEERNRRGQLTGKSRGNTTVVLEGSDALLAEELVPFVRELAQQVARRDGRRFLGREGDVEEETLFCR